MQIGAFRQLRTVQKACKTAFKPESWPQVILALHNHYSTRQMMGQVTMDLDSLSCKSICHNVAGSHYFVGGRIGEGFLSSMRDWSQHIYLFYSVSTTVYVHISGYLGCSPDLLYLMYQIFTVANLLVPYSDNATVPSQFVQASDLWRWKLGVKPATVVIEFEQQISFQIVLHLGHQFHIASYTFSNSAIFSDLYYRNGRLVTATSRHKVLTQTFLRAHINLG